MRKMLISLLLLCGAFKVSAQDFVFDTIKLQGNGCPDGSATVVTSPDQKSVSILFEQFIAEVPNFAPMANERMDHKICHIQIGAMIPVGHRIASLEADVDFRGSTQVGPGTTGVFRTMLVERSGLRSVDRQLKIIGARDWPSQGSDDDWLVQRSLNIPVQTSCATGFERRASFTLRSFITAQIAAQFDPNATFGHIMVDSSDITGSLKFKINTVPCRGGGVGPGPNPPNGPQVICRPPLVWDPWTRRCVRR